MTAFRSNSPPRLHVLETAADVDTWRGRTDREGTVVALTPEASLALEQAGVPHVTIEDFYDEVELRAAAGDCNDQLGALCDVLDRLIGVSFAQGLPAFSTRYYVGRLRVLRDNFLRAAFILDAMLARLCPAGVVMVDAPAPATDAIWLTDPRFLSWVLAEICRQRAIPTDRFAPPRPPAAPRPSIATRLRDILRGWRDCWRTMFPSHGDIMHSHWPARPDAALAEIGLRPVVLPPAPPVSAAPWTGDLSASDPFFCFGQVNLGALARPHLAELLGRFRRRHLACLGRAQTVLRRSGARAALAAGPLGAEPVAALLAARMAGKPAVVMQHGGFNGYCAWTMLPLLDFNLNDHYLHYGDGVGAATLPYTAARPPVRTQPVTLHAVGSVTVGAIHSARRAVRREGPPRALYVTSFLAGSTRYLGGHIRADIAYWRLQRAVIALLAATPGWEVDFRPPPHRVGDGAMAQLARDAQAAGIRLRHDGTLADLMGERDYDLIVTDAVATVLLEVLSTDARVIACFEPMVMDLSPAAAALLERRAELAFSTGEFLARIKDALHQPARPEQLDDSFLFSYALAGAGDPARRQAATLAAIVG